MPARPQPDLGRGRRHLPSPPISSPLARPFTACVTLPKTWRQVLVRTSDAIFYETNLSGESQDCRKVCDSTRAWKQGATSEQRRPTGCNVPAQPEPTAPRSSPVLLPNTRGGSIRLPLRQALYRSIFETIRIAPQQITDRLLTATCLYPGWAVLGDIVRLRRSTSKQCAYATISHLRHHRQTYSQINGIVS